MRHALAAVAVVLAALPAPAGDLLAGFGSADITPALGKAPVYVAGFGHNRVATRVHDPLAARAVYLSDGKTTIALVSVDLVGLFLPTVENVRAKLPEVSYVLVSSTHNHDGPDTLGLWGRTPFTTGVDPDYLKRVEAGCVAAVAQARKSARPVRAAVGTVRLPDLVNDNRLPVVKHDELVALKFTDAATGATAGAVVQWNSHPETLDSKNTEVSADFVGHAVARLERTLKAPAVYLSGTLGGLMTSLGVPVPGPPGVTLKDGTHAKTERYGELVADAAIQALGSAASVELTPFTVRTKVLLVRVDNDLYKLARRLNVVDRPVYDFPAAGGPETFTPSKDLTRPGALKTEVGYLKLGDLEVAAIPGEIYPELVLGKVQDPPDPGADYSDAPVEPAIYAHLTGKHRMLIGLANDELGYLIPKRQWDEKKPFCYGRTTAQYGEVNSVGPDAAAAICGAFRELARGSK